MRCFPALVVIAAAGCGGSDLTLPSEGLAAKIAAAKGDAQSATVSSVLPESLVVRVLDSRDRPVGNQRVDFTVDVGGGSVSPASSTTGADGFASTSWTLGAAAGAQRVTARATGNGAPPNLAVSFTASALTAAPAKLQKFAGDGQTASAGGFVQTPPAVKVTDAGGNPIQGVLVTFQVSLGGGTVAPTTPVSTDANGVAAATSWRLGNTAGQNQLTATVSAAGVSGNPAVFNATGAVGGANRLVFTVQPVNAAVGAPITPAIKVQVQDAAGNPVTAATNPITISLDNNPTGAALSGTTTVNAVGGTATFANLSINKPGTGYTLAATSTSGLTGAISTAFDVVNASSTTAITNISPNSTVVGQPYIVSFSVAAAPPASGTPTGVVTVSDGAGAACTAQAPSGSCALTSTGAGSKSVVATYAGDGNFAGSASPARTHSVGPATTTALITNVSPEPSAFGAPVTVSFTVTVNPPGAGTPVGNVTVTFQSGGSCLPQPVSAGQCTFVPTATGTKNLRALFTPSTADWSSDQSPNVAHTVTDATTTTAVGSNKNPANAGEVVTFAATVTVTGGAGTPTGTVTFRDGTATFATVSLAGNGTASTTEAFAAGQHNITAEYSGDANFAGSTSAVLIQQINAVNAAPTAVNDGPYSTNEDTPLTVAAPGVLANDTDPNGDPLTAGNASNPLHGTVTLNPNGAFTYTPDPNYNGPDSFTYTASDGSLNSSPATVTITVNSVNDPPSFTIPNTQDQASTVAPTQETRPGWVTNISPGPPDEVAAGQTVSFVVTTNHDELFAIAPGIDPSGTLTYTPAASASGPVTVTVVAHDSQGGTSGSQDFTITLNAQ